MDAIFQLVAYYIFSFLLISPNFEDMLIYVLKIPCFQLHILVYANSLVRFFRNAPIKLTYICLIGLPRSTLNLSQRKTITSLSLLEFGFFL